MWKIGQEVVIVNRQHRHKEPTFSTAVITKVGRKRVHYSDRWTGGKFHIKERYVDAGNYSPNETVYLSMQEYEDEKRKVDLWNKFKKSLYNGVMNDVTSEQIIASAKALNIELED